MRVAGEPTGEPIAPLVEQIFDLFFSSHAWNHGVSRKSFVKYGFQRA
jgi:hypothetical protein